MELVFPYLGLIVSLERKNFPNDQSKNKNYSGVLQANSYIFELPWLKLKRKFILQPGTRLAYKKSYYSFRQNMMLYQL